MKKYATNKLSDTTLRNAKPKDKLYRLRDGGGLSLDVLTTGTMIWRYNYRMHNKQKTYTIGNYEDVSLKEARIKRDEAKGKIQAGIDPSKQKQIEKNAIKENTFYAIAEIWMKEYIAKQSESHQTRTRAFLKRDIYTWLGKREITAIEAPEIIQVVKKVAERGAIDAAKRTKGIIQQVFDYAIAHDKAPRNPAKDINLRLILPKTTKKHYAVITDPAKLGELLRAIENYQGSTVVRAALKLLPMVMTRPSELTNAEWQEIDFDTSTWTIPAKRRKLLTHTKQANRPEDAHIVPLSDQAVETLKELHTYSSDGKYLFPSPRGRSRPISNNAIRTALRAMGFDNDTITAHGFRGVASTFLNTMGYRSEIIEAQLAHKDKNEIREAYNHADYIDERRVMLQEWATHLDSLCTDADVIPIKRAD